MAADSHAHQLLDQLGPAELAAVVRLLESIVPCEDESHTLSEREREAIADADEWLKHNEPIPHEQILSELGLTVADWDKMCEECLKEESPHRSG